MTNKINTLISEFNTLIARRNKAEKWYDEWKTTEEDRAKWETSIFKLNDDIDLKSKELELLGFVIQNEFIWHGIPE